MSESDNPENPESGRPKPGRVALPLWSGADAGPRHDPARMVAQRDAPDRPPPGRLGPAKLPPRDDGPHLDPNRPDTMGGTGGKPAEPAPARAPAPAEQRTIPLAPVTASERMAVGSQPKAPPPRTESPKPEPITRHTAARGSHPAGAESPGRPSSSHQPHDQTDASNRPRPGRVALPRWQEEEEAEEAKSAPPPGGPIPVNRARRGRRFARALLLFLVALLVYDVVDFVAALWERSPYLSVVFGFLLTLVFSTALGLILGELRQLQRLSQSETYHARIAALHAGGGQGKALPLAVKLLPGLPAPEAAKERFAVSVHDTHSDRDVIELFNRTVMHPLDRQAYSIITKAARDSAVGVAVSPVAALDAVIALWRSLRMIREIAQVYGFRPGMPGTLAIARRVILGTALTATTDVIGNLWAEHLGGRVAGLLSAKLGEGVFAAIRVARLGLTTMEMCRPLPFLKEDEPSLNRLRKEIVSGLIAGSGNPPKTGG